MSSEKKKKTRKGGKKNDSEYSILSVYTNHSDGHSTWRSYSIHKDRFITERGPSADTKIASINALVEHLQELKKSIEKFPI